MPTSSNAHSHNIESLLYNAMDQASIGMILCDAYEGKGLFCNNAAEKILRIPKSKLLKDCNCNTFCDYTVLNKDRKIFNYNETPFIQSIMNKKELTNQHIYLIKDNEDQIHLLSNYTPIFGKNNEVVACNILFLEVSNQTKLWSNLNFYTDICNIINKSEGLYDICQAISKSIIANFNFDAVGIRIKDGYDYPFFLTRGFPEDFVIAENSLCEKYKDGSIKLDSEGNPALECMCGNIICGRVDSRYPFFTENGSFWTNCTTDLLASTTPEGRQANTRNRCHGEGYECVALFPLRSENNVFGLLHIVNKKKNCFNKELIHNFENIANFLAGAIRRNQLKDNLLQHQKDLKNTIEQKTKTLKQTISILEKSKEESQKQKSQLQNLFDHMNDALVLFELVFNNQGEPVDFKFLDLNPIYEEIIEVKKEDVVGKTAKEIFNVSELPDFEAISLVGLTGIPNKLCTYFTPKEIYINLSIFSPEKNKVALVFSDITQSKRIELKLKSIVKELEETNLRLSEAHSHKNRFLSSVSHELRTPLNAILGFSKTLNKEYFGPLNEKQKEYISLIYDSGDHLLTLINNILDISKIDAGSMDFIPTKFEVQEYIIEVMSLLTTLFEDKNIQTSYIIDNQINYILADKTKCKQILLNLLNNAIKFTPEYGSITVEASLMDNQKIKISVTDTGIGITEKDKQNVFSEFYQGEQTQKQALGGTGIGLALSKRLIKMHHGEIGCESTTGKGSTFWFILPLMQPKKHL